MPRLSLVAKFSVTSFMLLAAIGVLLGLGLSERLKEQAIDQQKLTVSALVPPIVGWYLTDDILANGAHGKSYQGIDEALSYLGGLGLVRVRIVNKQGVIVYADHASLIGQSEAQDPSLKQALDGTADARLITEDDPRSLEDQGYGTLLLVYTPIQLQGKNDTGSVFEGYYDADDLIDRINYINTYLWVGIALGFVFLYTALFTIVYNASGNLTRQNRENSRLYKQSESRLAERIEAEKQKQRQVERLAALRAIDTAITSSPDLRLTLDVILDQVCTQLHVDAATILLLNSESTHLTYAAGRGFRSRAVEGTVVRRGDGPAGKAIYINRPSGILKLQDSSRELNSGRLGSGKGRAALLANEDFVAYCVVPLMAKGQVKGVLEVFHRAPLDPSDEWMGFLEALAGQTAIAVDNAQLFSDLEKSNLNLALAYDMTLEGWSRALDLRDKETEGHTQRVTEVSVKLARFMGVTEAELVHIRRGALLHDIGKMGIPDSILLKPGPLTPGEWDVMKRHPIYAYEMLSPISFLKEALDIPHYHHERWDGKGYPLGLKGDEIPLAARIFAVVDVWDALSFDRPYRKAFPKEKVYAHIISQSGEHFDPRVVKAFMRMQSADRLANGAVPAPEGQAPREAALLPATR